MFSLKSTNDLVRIAAAGGGFALDAALRPTNDLVRIAAAASSKGARLIFRGMTMRPQDDLVRIAAAGGGCVEFAE
jgi:hypothetical protein